MESCLVRVCLKVNLQALVLCLMYIAFALGLVSDKALMPVIQLFYIYCFTHNLYVVCPFLGISDCKSVIEKLTEHYDKLTRLPINSMLDSLITSEVITFDEKKNIETKSLESDRMRHLLDNVIILGLQVELPELYHKFVKVLQESESMINRAMAKMIGIVYTHTHAHAHTHTHTHTLYIHIYTTIVVYSRDHKGVGVPHEIASPKK